MAGVGDTRALFLARNLLVEIGRHALELADHVLENGALARGRLNLEAFRLDPFLACGHGGSFPWPSVANVSDAC